MDARCSKHDFMNMTSCVNDVDKQSKLTHMTSCLLQLDGLAK